MLNGAHIPSEGLERAKEVMKLEGSGAVLRPALWCHIWDTLSGGSGRYQGGGRGQFFSVLGLGSPTWEHEGALEKSSSRQGCIQTPSLCLEKRTSEWRS